MLNGKILTAIALLVVLSAGLHVALAQEGKPRDATMDEGDASADRGGEKDTKAPEAPKDKGGGAGGGDRGGGMQYWPLLLMIGAFFLLYMWMGRGRRKEQQRRRAMLADLKKGDKVTTIGGIVGTLMEIRDDEVTVKVDESANVRMRFARWAVRGVGDVAKAENPAQAARQQQQSQSK